ncbi:MAG: MBG-2 domain-containing protein, partial [Erysipelotrichaceae bacterium]|nr:MBG-2 domain-containing protein [Erysipelotrichaceae bacterium]
DPTDPDPTDPNQPVYSGITVNDPDNYEYDNSRHIWEPTVTAADGQPALVKGTDYTVRYEDKDGNVLDTNDINSRDFKDVKEITVIITGTGNYGGEVRKTYEITRKTVTVKATPQLKYYGDPDKPYQVSVLGLAVFDDRSLITYDVTRTPGEDVIDEPYYPIIVTGDAVQGNYNVQYENGWVRILPKDIEGMVANKPVDVPYNGLPQEWKPIMKDGDKVLVEDQDYTVTYTEDTTNVGEIEVTITGIGNYGGKLWPKYNITPAQLTVTTESATKVYDGTALTAPGKVDGLQNKETVAFTVTGTQTDVGNSINTYTLAWTGTAKATNYTIVTPENLGTLTVTKQSITPGTDPDNPDPSYDGVKVGQPDDTTYTGTEQKMPVDVTDKDGNPLTPGDDYTITYTPATNAGDVTVTITGINNYTGTVEKTYKINPAPLTVTTPSDAKVYDGTALTKAGKVEGFVNNETATFTTTGTQTAVGKSTNDYSLVFDGTANRNNYSITENLGTLTVCKQSIDPDDPTDPNPDDPYDPIYAGIEIQDPTDVTYTGQPQKWTPTVTTKDGTDLREGIDYEVQYDTTDFTNVNTAITVTIYGRGNYGGDVTKVYAITPAKVTVQAENKSKTYGEADPALTAKVSGLVNNEPESLITYTLSRAPGEEVNGSPYPIAPQGSETQGNYTVEYKIGNLTINPKKIDSNDIKVDDPGKYTYNGKEQKYVPEVVDNTTKETLTQTDGDYTVTYVDKDGNPVTDFTNVNGDITVIITGNGNYTGTVEKTYHIDPKTVKVTTENGTKVFDNDYLEGTGTIEGIVDGETVTFEVTGKIKDVQLDPAGNVVGVDNTYEITWDGTAKSTNYVIDPTLGQLTVTPRPIDDPNYNFDVENLFDRYYNGLEQKETPVVIDVDSKPDYEDEEYEDYEDYEDEEYEDYEGEENLESEEETKTGGIDHVVVQPKIAALSTGITAGRAVTTGRTLRYGIDYTVVFDPSNNYVNVTGQPIKVQIIGMGNYKGVINRTYYILARTLQITTPSASKVYDGTPLKATTSTVSGLVNGETVTVSVTGSQTAVGSSQNTYTINWGTAKAFNYVIDDKLGTLTVTAPAVGPTPPVVPPTEPDTPTPVTPVVPVQPVVVADDETPGAPTELLLERLDEELVERGEFGLRGGYCILHIFIFLLAAVVEAFLLVKVKKDNKELE